MQDKGQVWLGGRHKDQGDESTELLLQQWMEIPKAQKPSQLPHT